MTETGRRLIVGILIVIILCYGTRYIIGLSIGFLSLILGASYRLYNKSILESKEQVDKRKVKLIRKILLAEEANNGASSETSRDGESTSSVEPKSQSSLKPSRNKMDMRLTGSAIIDETLHEMIDFLLRDYVHSWYDHISDDDEFIHELRKTMQETIVNLSSRIKEIDWIPYLTTQLVDDAASHLRLYRTALAKTKENPNSSDLISVFFDIEATMEKNLCRDMVCTDDSHLHDYLQGISEDLAYLLLPQDTYSCTPVGALAQDLLVNYVFVPILQLFSDPDFVNQYIMWLCQNFTVTPDILLSVIRMCDNMDEAAAVLYFFDQQIADMRDSLDNKTLPEEQAVIRSQLKGLSFVKKLIEQRLSHLKEGKQTDWTDDGMDPWQNYFMTPGLKLHSLTLDEVLKNSVALSYFIDYMNSVNGNHYILMYLNADAWKTSAEQQLTAIESTNKNVKLTRDQIENNQAMLDCMRDAAINVYDQFLSEKAVPRVKLSENVVKRFYIHVRTEPTIHTNLFDEIQESLIEVMQTTEKFYPSFLRHKLYVKCLMEIDLLKAESVTTNVSDDEEDEDLVEEYEDIGSESLTHVSSSSSNLSSLSMDYDGPPVREDYQLCRDCLKQRKLKFLSLAPADELTWEKNVWMKKYKLNAEIIEAGLATEKGKQYGVYAVQVTRLDDNDKKEKKWHIYRRYSDFYDFHQWIKSKWAMLNRIEFPGKHTFRTTDRMFLEKRMVALNKYLCSILTMTVDPCFGESLQDSLLHFLEPGNYVIKKKQFSEKIDELVVNPLKQSVRSVSDVVKSVPDTFINTAVDGFSKIFHSKAQDRCFVEANKVGASIDEADDNIPLRIILLLMDEVFDLKSRNQWLRRRIVAIIRQVLKAMLGDTINRRIVDYVAYLTSPVRVSGYLQTLQKSLWPGGWRISARPVRDSETKMRTRFAAKLSLLASLSDELKHLIGSETTRRGLLCVFDLCQNPVLNRRFILVLFEGILKTLFPDKPFSTVIMRLHTRSNRVGKHRPFIIPTTTPSTLTTRASSSSMNTGSPATSMPYVSPRSSRKKK